MKGYLKSFLIVAVSLAVINRVAAIKNITG